MTYVKRSTTMTMLNRGALPRDCYAGHLLVTTCMTTTAGRDDCYIYGRRAHEKTEGVTTLRDMLVPESWMNL